MTLALRKATARKKHRHSPRKFIMQSTWGKYFPTTIRESSNYPTKLRTNVEGNVRRCQLKIRNSWGLEVS